MLQGLAKAGADVVMHGLITQEEAQQRTAAIEGEYGVRCGHSAANVMKPAEIRFGTPLASFGTCEYGRRRMHHHGCVACAGT